MSINYMMGALSALILKQRGVANNRALAGGALSAMTPGILGLAIPLVMTSQRGKGIVGGTSPSLPGPVTLVQLANVVGSTKEAAKATLTGQGQSQHVKFVTATVQVAAGVAVPLANTVVKQWPEAQELVPLGGHVTAWVTAPADPNAMAAPVAAAPVAAAPVAAPVAAAPVAAAPVAAVPVVAAPVVAAPVAAAPVAPPPAKPVP